MSTLKQDDFLLPLLIELAVRGGRIAVHRGSSDLDDVESHLEILLRTSSSRWGTTKNRQPRFRNWIEWAKKELKDAGLVAGSHRVDWRVTNQGYDRLRELVKNYVRFHRHSDREKAEKYLFEPIDGCEFCRLSQVLESLDTNDLRSCVCNSASPYEMFLSAMDKIRVDGLEKFLLWSWEDIGDWLMEP